MRLYIFALFLLLSKLTNAQSFFGSFDRSYYGVGLAYLGAPEGGGMNFPMQLAAERYLNEGGHFYQKLGASLAFGNDWFTQYDYRVLKDGFLLGSISTYWYATPTPEWPLSFHFGGGPGLAIVSEFSSATVLLPTIGFSPGIRIGKQSRRTQFVFCYNFYGGFADFRFQKEIIQTSANLGLSFRLD